MKNAAIKTLTLEQLANVLPRVTNTGKADKMSARYVPIKGYDVIASLYEAGYAVRTYGAKNARNTAQRDMGKYMVRMVKTDSLKTGERTPEIILFNSHDGTTALQVSFGMCELVCANGLTVFRGEVEKYTIKHIGSSVEDKISEMLTTLTGYGQTVEEIVAEMRQIKLTPAEQRELAHLTAIAAVDAKQSHLKSEGMIPDLDSLLRADFVEQAGDSGWDTLNRVHGNIIRGTWGYTYRPTADGEVPHKARPNRLTALERQVNGVSVVGDAARHARINEAIYRTADNYIFGQRPSGLIVPAELV